MDSVSLPQECEPSCERNLSEKESGGRAVAILPRFVLLIPGHQPAMPIMLFLMEAREVVIRCEASQQVGQTTQEPLAGMEPESAGGKRQLKSTLRVPTEPSASFTVGFFFFFPIFTPRVY